MSTQSYYKDRLGFDPNEAGDGNPFDKNQQGYEENLSKFKGLWEIFVLTLGEGIFLYFLLADCSAVCHPETAWFSCQVTP
jgi:hypothetical protein